MENAVSNLEFGGVENFGWKMLSRISNLGGGKFGVENAISNLEFGGWKIWGGKCYLESPIWVGGKFGVDNVISTFLNWGGGGGGGKFGVENAISKFLIWGGGVENLGWKMLSNFEFWGWKI